MAVLGLLFFTPALMPDASSASPPDEFDVIAGMIGRSDAAYVVHGFTDAPDRETFARPPAGSTVLQAYPPPVYLPFLTRAEGQSPATPTVTPTATPAPTLTPTATPTRPPDALASERRAIWITRYDWTNIETAAEPAVIDEMVDNVAGAGFNTIFFQIRGAGDAFYTPGLEPWSSRLTGSAWETLGQDPGWDPLARMLERAHAAGLEVHAYVNVYSIWIAPPGEDYGELWPPKTDPPHMFDRFTYGPTYEAHPGEYALGYKWRHYDEQENPMLLDWNTYLWATPGRDEVQDYTVSVITDIVRRYAVDGVHLDYIRYAGPTYSYDPASVDAAGVERDPERDQWQRDRVTALVQRIYTETHALRPNLLVSAAVWPYYTDEWGWEGVSYVEGYDDYFQDSKGWLRSGAVDAIVPMLYGGHADDFERWTILMHDFLDDSDGRPVYPGIGGFNVDGFEDIADRIEAARQAGASGHAVFSYGLIERKGYWDKFAAGPYAQPAVP